MQRSRVCLCEGAVTRVCLCEGAVRVPMRRSRAYMRTKDS